MPAYSMFGEQNAPHEADGIKWRVDPSFNEEQGGEAAGVSGVFGLFCRAGLGREIEQKRDRLYRMAYAWCHDPALADDLVQEALTKALRNGRQLRDRARLDTWLFRILANCWHDHLRSHRPAEDVDDLVLGHDETPEVQHGRNQLVATVRAAVASLPLGQREAVTLVDLEGLSYAETADVLEVPVGTVMSRISRGRARLKTLLQAYQAQELREATAPPVRLRRVK